jgi:Fur family transcriptional regulator, ferric uptake regulator
VSNKYSTWDHLLSRVRTPYDDPAGLGNVINRASPRRPNIDVVAGPFDLAQRLHSRGLRMTPQRQQVLDAVQALEHATPEQISAAVPDIDVATVYRTVELLEELGLLRHTHLGHGAASFRLAENEHVHVVCHNCNRVIDVPHDLIDGLVDRLADERGFTVDRSHFTVFGRCAQCGRYDPRETGADLEQGHSHVG